MAALTQPVPQEAVVSDVLAKIPMPAGVRLRRFYFDHDHSGDPALRVVYGVSKRLPWTKKRVSALASFRRNVGSLLWDVRSGWIPYVTFEDVR